jgi:membrane fusion protein (multidrug efflux system)
VTLLMANGRQFAEPGHIAVIEADFNNRTGTIPFRADFANPTGLLRHGQTGKILLAKPIPGALLVPQKATFEILDQTYVYVVARGRAGAAAAHRDRRRAGGRLRRGRRAGGR